LPCIRKLSDLVYSRRDFVKEVSTLVRAIVSHNSEVSRRGRPQPQRQSGLSRFPVLPENLFERYRFHFAAKIGTEAVTSFFGPQPVDFRISRIEAALKVLDKLDALFPA
jgi:hypothetical protein